MKKTRTYPARETVKTEVLKGFLPFCPECDSMLRGSSVTGNVWCDCGARWYWSRGREKDGEYHGILTRQ